MLATSGTFTTSRWGASVADTSAGEPLSTVLESTAASSPTLESMALGARVDGVGAVGAGVCADASVCGDHGRSARRKPREGEDKK